jgi:2-haloacid dehalogenase
MKAVVFDAYGTLFDVASVIDACRELVPDPEAFSTVWRAKQLEYTFLRSLMNRYADFWQVTEEALVYACKRRGLVVSTGQKHRLMDSWLHLRPFPEVAAALRSLQAYKRVVLSNGSPTMLGSLLENCGLKAELDLVLSADAVQIYKPARQVYELAVQHLGGTREEIVFLSANGFDVAGAKAFGLTVCWVNRAGATLEELGIEPDATVQSLTEVTGVLAQVAHRSA